jgi:hypothetical protein
MTGWTLRVVWPVEDPAAFSEESIAVARADLLAIAEGFQPTLLAPPVFPTRTGEVICEVPVCRQVSG